MGTEVQKATLTAVEAEKAPINRYRPVLGEESFREFENSMRELASILRGRVIWNVNSTAQGGGVAELLATLIPYRRGVGIDERWVVIEGSPEFFDVTKRIHNLLHGVSVDGSQISDQERRVYERSMQRNAMALTEVIHPRDVVILHDPQSAGLVPSLHEHGATVIWRSHVGVDEPNDVARSAWALLRPYLAPAGALVFSRRNYVWEGLDQSKVNIIQPCIDAFSPKNRDLDAGEMSEILAANRLPDQDRIVLQVSRWDRLKDPFGVMTGFARFVAAHVPDAILVLAGPAATSVADDPEQPEILARLEQERKALGREVADRIRIAQLPMDDEDENALIVNALQRRAEVVVQKSLAEGFGLTVAEAMWKSRPVVASRVGGIEDQIEDGKSGVLIEPKNLEQFGGAITQLLHDEDRARRIGDEARNRIRSQFLGPRHLMQEGRLIRKLI